MPEKRILPQRHVQLGAQIYVNKYDTPAEMREWVRKLHKSGLSIFRVFIFWDIIQPARDQWDFSVYDAIFDEAEKLGLQVVGTMWCVNPPGCLNIIDTFRNFGDLNDPRYWNDVALDYVRRVTKRYHRSPALNAWVNWKEASRPLKKNPNSMRAFREYLRVVYKGDIENLNRVYYNKFSSFDEVGELTQAYINHEFAPYPDTLDWERFSNYNLCEKLRDIYNTIRSIDKVHPIYVNPHSVSNNLQPWGQSIWNEAKEVDFLGLSNHPAWSATRVLQEPYRLNQYVAYNADIVKSATPAANGFWEVTEIQGGPTMMSGHKYTTTSPEEINHYTWECLASGAARVLYWTFNERKTGHEAGEWTLVGQDGEATERLDALGENAAIIRENQALLDGASHKLDDVYILHSELSRQLAMLEGGNGTVEAGNEYDPDSGKSSGPHNPRNTEYASDAMLGAYLMLSDLGLSVSFISEEQVIAGALPKDAVLIAPSCIAVEDGLCAAVEAFVQGGGCFIADFVFAMKDRYGFLPDKNANKAVNSRMFGAVLTDIMPAAEEIAIRTDGFELEGWFLRLPMKAVDCEVLGTFENGRPAVVGNRHGEGRAVRIGTTFFQRYLTKPLGAHLDFLRSLLPEQLFQGIRLETGPDEKLRLREMVSGEKRILILLNDGAAKTAVLRCPYGGELRALRGGESIAVEVGKPVSIPLAASEVKPLVLTPEHN